MRCRRSSTTKLVESNVFRKSQAWAESDVLNSANGGATVTVPAAGFADATLASVIQQRVNGPKDASASFPTNNAPSKEHGTNTNHTNTGAIAGGVVGGVVGLAFVAGAGWLLFRRSRAADNDAVDYKPGGELPPAVQEMDAEKPHEAPAYGALSEVSGECTSELPGTRVVAELEGDGKISGSAFVDTTRWMESSRCSLGPGKSHIR